MSCQSVWVLFFFSKKNSVYILHSTIRNQYSRRIKEEETAHNTHKHIPGVFRIRQARLNSILFIRAGLYNRSAANVTVSVRIHQAETLYRRPQCPLWQSMLQNSSFFFLACVMGNIGLAVGHPRVCRQLCEDQQHPTRKSKKFHYNTQLALHHPEQLERFFVYTRN